MKQYKYKWMESAIKTNLEVVGDALSIYRMSICMSAAPHVSGRILNIDNTIVKRDEFFTAITELMGMKVPTPFKVPAIGFNIWDDYYDDGYVPNGEIQRTHGYLEGWKDTKEEKIEVIKFIYNHLMTLSLPGVILDLGEEEIFFKYLTHERRVTLVEELGTSGLKWKDKLITFYSES